MNIMNIARIIVRVLVGVLFIFAGASDFFTTPPPMPGLVGAFNELFFKSHWVLFLAVAQIAIGGLLVVNRFVPVALIMLAAFLYNSFGFHITIFPAAIWAPIVVTAAWVFIAWPYRALFAPIFRAKPIP